jgi:CRP/FNR family transcriptional regulator
MKPIDPIPDCSKCKNVSTGESIFSDCPLKELENSFPSKEFLSFAKGEHLNRANDPFDGLYCIYSGKVRVYRTGKDNIEETLYYLEAGDLVAPTPGQSELTHTHSTVAEEATRVCFIPHSDLDEAKIKMEMF